MGFAGVKEFFQPESAQEAVNWLAQHRERALLLGGGTFLHSLASRGLLSTTDALIDLQKAGLSFVKQEPDALAIGATTTFAELAAIQR
jgi:CO/xanthine dehydrogenase FAD-binding subunit